MKKLAKILSWLGEFEDKKARDEYLKSKGYDLDKLEEEGVNTFKKALAENKLKKAREKRGFLKRAQELLESQSQDVSLKSILSNMQSPESEFAFQFSKLDDISDEDALKMFNDEQLLKIIEKLEKEDEQ